MDPFLEKSIEVCLDEIKGLMCSSQVSETKYRYSNKGSKTTNDSVCNESKDYPVNWRRILLRLFEDVRKENSRPFDVDSILTLIVNLRDRLKVHLTRSSSYTSETWSNLLDTSDDFESASLVTAETTNFSPTLTQDNVEINEIWESLWHHIKGIIVERLIENRLNDVIEKEFFYQEMLLLNSMRLSEETNLSNFFNYIRLQRIERQLNLTASLEETIEQIKKWISFDLELVDSYHLFQNQVSFHQIVTPYINLIKGFVEDEDRVHVKSDIDPPALIGVINLLHEFDCFLTERDINIPSENNSPARDINDIWDWRGYFVQLGVDNLLLRYLNQGLMNLMTISNPIDQQQSTTDQIQTFFQDDNVLTSIHDIFEFLNSFASIDLPGFKNSFSVIVNVTVIDFILKTLEVWLKIETTSLEPFYGLYNSFLFAKSKLEQYGLHNRKICDVLVQIRSTIMTKHLNILLFSFKSLEYILIYMKKLEVNLLKSIPYEKQDDSHIFVTLIRHYLQHIIKINLDGEDVLVLCANVIDLLMPFSISLDDLFYKKFDEIHSCCLILILRLSLTKAPLSILHSVLHDAQTSQSSSSSLHWLNLFDKCIMTVPRPSNAFLASLQQVRPSSSSVIRPFLESRLSFSINLFTHRIQPVAENEKSIIKLLSTVIKLAMLNESQEKSISYLLSAIIQKNNHWMWLDVSKLLVDPKPWWLEAVLTVLDEIVEHFVAAILVPLIYRYSLRSSQYRSFYDQTGIFERYLELDETVLVEESTKTLLTSINTIMETLPITLVASFEELKNIKMITIRTLFDSLTGQLIISSILRCLKRPQFLPNTYPDGIELLSKIFDKLEKDVQDHGERWTTMGSNLSTVVERRLSRKTSYVVASESDQFDLIGYELDKDSTHQPMVDYLYRFLVANRSSLGKTGNNQEAEIVFNLEHKSNMSWRFDILSFRGSIRSPKLENIGEDKWIQLVGHVKSKLSPLSIGHLLSERDDLMYDQDENSMDIKKNYGLIS